MLICVTHAEAATDIQNFQDDTLLAQVEQVSGEALQGAAERSKFDNLRTDVGADSLPADGLCVSMLEIKFAGLGPGHAEFVVLQAGGDVRVAPSFYIRIHADGDAGRLSMHAARCFLNQDFKFRGGFNIELQNSRVPTPLALIAQRFTDFFTSLSHSRQYNATTGDTDVAEVFEFAAGDNVEAAAEVTE